MDSLAGTQDPRHADARRHPVKQQEDEVQQKQERLVLRRTRFVCVSDTHNTAVKLPKGDVLIHAGDLTNQGSYSELSRAVQWLEKADFEAKIVIAGTVPNHHRHCLTRSHSPGNHDITLDPTFYAEHGSNFHNQAPQSSPDCIALLTSSPSITHLDHASTTVRLSSPSGPHTTFSVFGSPYSPRHGLWAFGYDPPLGDGSLWDDIPSDADVVVTHTPSRTHCDGSDVRPPSGCEALRRALWKVRPRLAVCGHVHEGRGAERVRWDLGVEFGEDAVEAWQDPGAGGNKQSLVDLTRRSGRPLANDGAREPGPDAEPGIGDGSSADPGSAEATRAGRRETCVVNCAVMAKSWPHVGGKTTNKPIVVDLDLPVWE
ncbi:ser thr protein phosphatase family protein [Colletotrichum musicola]|uniref:Ser thr protein phosphatase family protein n=1 Tax=Colletotrichum musicola TaxID=2175873 RepID=A0A8H6KLR5_9PEZI|nr:ser thr protein phosphatase family protein [Colletotrichum musicola]